ncbi:hypothetical protein KW785_03085 [Candidatus Parcubacteria bacterium]|nr:hypothetical protein [Candidatus Parcubacteria bacterium]
MQKLVALLEGKIERNEMRLQNNSLKPHHAQTIREQNADYTRTLREIQPAPPQPPS